MTLMCVQVYSLTEGCYGKSGCGGYFTITGATDAFPTAPIENPTPAPTPPPTDGLLCPSFNVTDTDYDRQNFAKCDFYMCPGSTVAINGCDACEGDQ